MTLDLPNVLLAISSSVLVGLLTIVWYGLKVFANNVKELKSAVSEMNTLMGIIQEKIANITKDINRSDSSVESRIKDIMDDINRLDCEVYELKREVEIIKAIEHERNKK